MEANSYTVAQIMTKDVVSVGEDEDLTGLETAMRLLRFRHMPVTQDGRLVGVLTQRDVLRMAASSLLPNAREQNELLARRYRVRDVMTVGVRTVLPDTPIVEAARMMHREKLGSLPVVDDKNALVGILTESDFVLLALRLLSGEPPVVNPVRSRGN